MLGVRVAILKWVVQEGLTDKMKFHHQEGREQAMAQISESSKYRHSSQFFNDFFYCNEIYMT